MNIGEGSEKEIRKDRKIILKEERSKKEKLVEVWKIEVMNSSLSETVWWALSNVSLIVGIH